MGDLCINFYPKINVYHYNFIIIKSQAVEVTYLINIEMFNCNRNNETSYTLQRVVFNI